MRPLHIIMPMAGEGTRFKLKGYNHPKPLIKYRGKYLFLRAIDSVANIKVFKKYSFIVRSEHIREYLIDQKIKDFFPEANIFVVKKTTRGAVETCYFAKDFVDDNDSVLVMDCDLEFYSSEYNSRIIKFLNIPTRDAKGGVVVSFDAKDCRYSFAKIDKNNKVLETAEKKVISNHALVGAYFFSTKKVFFSSAEKIIKKRGVRELYVSLLYNILIEYNQGVYLAKTDKYFSYGTPEELEALDYYGRN